MKRYWNKFLNWLIPNRIERLIAKIMKLDQELDLYDEPSKKKKMKAIIEFNLPEDRDEYDMANNASKMYLALWDIKQLFRSTLKYNPTGLSTVQLEQWEAMQDEFYVILDNNDLKLD